MWWADVVKPKKLQGKHCIRELVFQTAEGSTLLFLTKKKKKFLAGWEEYPSLRGVPRLQQLLCDLSPG